MDKFLIKKRKVDESEVKSNTDTSQEKQIPHVNVAKVAPKDNGPISVGPVRKYHDNYLNFGFKISGSEDLPLPQCVICGEQLSNESMVPSKLKRHFNSKHSHLSGKDRNYFTRLIEVDKNQAKSMTRRVTISDKVQVASYKDAEIVAKHMQPHTIAEDVILPACKEIVKSMLGDNAEKEISLVPLSDNTISRRIDDLSSDIQNQVREKLNGPTFSLQLDESTDISNKCQFLSYIRFVDEESIIEQFFACAELSSTSTGLDVYNSISSTLEINGLSWDNCLSVCIDGAPAMTGRFKGFVSRLKQNFLNVGSTHCFIHREVLVAKTIPTELKNVLDSVVKMVNFIKSRPLKTRLFNEMCHKAGSHHDTLILNTDIHWLSKGKVLARFFELRSELFDFFTTENTEFATYFKDEQWCTKLSYLVDIFRHLNHLNKSMQGKQENLLTSSDKLSGFLSKLNIWRSEVKKKNLQMFPLTFELDPDGSLTSGLIGTHLLALQNSMEQYFPSIAVNTSKYDWVRNPYVVQLESIDLPIADQLAELQSDRTLKLKYDELTLFKFGYS